MKKAYIWLPIVLALLIGLSMPLQQTLALSGSEFQAGRIIDDDKFFNGSSMNAQEIQAFLNAKILSGSCDTNGAKAYSPGVTRAQHGALQGYSAPYTCLKDYKQNTSSRASEAGLCGSYTGGYKSAAQIISDVSIACGVSPKVLIVLLEKEQSLVSDDWPWSKQYSAATGFGCPDTAPCDAQYGAFFDQVYYAARQFRMYGYKANLFRYRAFRDNYIQYNPNSGCSGTNIYLQNQATAGLYNYTPYQPNNAALTNLNGTGDSCSAYGNRNFWKLYNNWFGTSTVSYANNSAYAKLNCNIAPYGTNQVGRMYNAETRDYLFTTSQLEACLAMKAGYIWDGIQFENYVAGSDTTPVYRLGNYTRHIFTSSDAVKQDYMNNRGYRYEGIAFYAKTNPQNNTPVYCYVRDDTVVYTNAGGEATLLEQEGYSNVGTAFYTGQMSLQPKNLYRLSRGTERLYTVDDHERDVAQLFYGFVWERPQNIPQYPINPGPGLAPVYRLSAPGNHFYTTNRGERDIAVIYYGYFSEGTGFYANVDQQPGSTPVYRLNNKYNNRLYTSSTAEKQSAINSYGYTDEGISWYAPAN